ncbi:hypothetical protein EJ04DRAFT_558045 [Polyplosphaeria fusca]|uniref:Uncharacterized protein n=1 Tax=Polyplosphaeria fusca TaxID=682080 RepID=A0A9P4RAS6_9PLEO|nr:hypothetical protein EJ04DRAFT_558045 [Polyplosphaeria fusca]
MAYRKAATKDNSDDFERMAFGFAEPDPAISEVYTDPSNIPRSDRPDWRLRRDDTSGTSGVSRGMAYAADLAVKIGGIGKLKVDGRSVSQVSVLSGSLASEPKSTLAGKGVINLEDGWPSPVPRATGPPHTSFPAMKVLSAVLDVKGTEVSDRDLLARPATARFVNDETKANNAFVSEITGCSEENGLEILDEQHKLLDKFKSNTQPELDRASTAETNVQDGRYENAMKIIEWETYLGINEAQRQELGELLAMQETYFWRTLHKVLGAILPFLDNLEEKKEAKTKAKENEKALAQLHEKLQAEYGDMPSQSMNLNAADFEDSVTSSWGVDSDDEDDGGVVFGGRMTSTKLG